VTESPATATAGAAVNVGVISDTHGLIRPETLAALAGSDLIIHAGDIGSPDVITALKHIAPVHAIRGNVDRADWALRFPETWPSKPGAYGCGCCTTSRLSILTRQPPVSRP
jgi:putative phosphoesterase